MLSSLLNMGRRSTACWVAALFWFAAITQHSWIADCFPLHNNARLCHSNSNKNRQSILSQDHFLARPPRSRRRRRRSLLGICAAAVDDSEEFDWSTAIENQPDAISSALDNNDKQREAENIYIPKGGISVSDEIEASQRDRFQTQVIPIKGFPNNGAAVAQLVTTSMTRDSFEPVRYLVSLSATAVRNGNPSIDANVDDGKTTVPSENLFVMVDVPPYSPRLVAEMQAFMRDSSSSSSNNCRLAAILITSRDAIHYDEAPGAFSVRRSHVVLWKQAIPDLQIAAYRLDIPRDCRSAVTQVLDGQGPFGAGTTTTTAAATTTLTVENASSNNGLSFVEMGRPLTYDAWDYHTAQQVLRGEKPPPDDADGSTTFAQNEKDNDEYSAEAIRLREAERSVLAVFTPGHTFGSLSYVFPQLKVCCSGFCIPVEDNRAQEDDDGNMLGDGGGAGPALDVRGYITTSRAGITRQMESAKKLVKTYVDRFHTVLPSRGDPLFLDENDVPERRAELLEIIQQYKRIGEIYDQLGITSKDDSHDSQ